MVDIVMTSAEALQRSPSITAAIAGTGHGLPADSWLLPVLVLGGAITLLCLWWWRQRLFAARSLRGMARYQENIEGWLWEYRAYDGCLACPEFARCLGLPENARYALAPTLRKYVHRSDRSRILQASASIASGERSVDFAVRVKSGTGEFRWWHWQGAVTDLDAQGRPLSVAGICRDITLENSAEFQARLAAQVMDAASDAVVVIDRSFRIVSVNASFTKVTGFRPDDVMGRNPRIVYGRLTGWGQDGPLAQQAGHSLNYEAVTGVIHAIGRPEVPPSISAQSRHILPTRFSIARMCSGFRHRIRSPMRGHPFPPLRESNSYISDLTIDIR